jgi:hypothetical protein
MLLNYYFKFEEGVLMMANVMNVTEGYSLFVLTFFCTKFLLLATVLGFRTLRSTEQFSLILFLHSV